MTNETTKPETIETCFAQIEDLYGSLPVSKDQPDLHEKPIEENKAILSIKRVEAHDAYSVSLAGFRFFIKKREGVASFKIPSILIGSRYSLPPEHIQVSAIEGIRTNVTRELVSWAVRAYQANTVSDFPYQPSYDTGSPTTPPTRG